MVFKGLIAATAAVALSATPAIASASASRAASAQTEVAPAAETVDAEGSELLQRGRGGFFGGGWFIPLAALVAIILGILALSDDNDEDLPASP